MYIHLSVLLCLPQLQEVQDCHSREKAELLAHHTAQLESLELKLKRDKVRLLIACELHSHLLKFQRLTHGICCHGRDITCLPCLDSCLSVCVCVGGGGGGGGFVVCEKYVIYCCCCCCLHDCRMRRCLDCSRRWQSSSCTPEQQPAAQPRSGTAG